MQNQINGFIKNFSSTCGCTKGYNRQQELLPRFEKWKNNFDDKVFGEEALMGLSKAFGTLNHDLLIVELNMMY